MPAPHQAVRAWGRISSQFATLDGSGGEGRNPDLFETCRVTNKMGNRIAIRDLILIVALQGRPRGYLSTTTVVRLIKTTARKAGLPAADVAGFSGHSMRVGAAQDLLRAGRDTSAIMRAGGWKSIEILSRYLEKAELNVWAA